MLTLVNRGPAVIRTAALRRLILMRGIPDQLRGELWETLYGKRHGAVAVRYHTVAKQFTSCSGRRTRFL